MKYVVLSVLFLAIMRQASAHVDLDSPVGGENYDPGQVVVIKWSIRIAHPQDNWDLYFSTDSGVTWQELGIDLPVSQLSFTWTVPDVSTPNAKIKIVMDNQGPDYESISNDFAIGVFVPLMLNYPMGNETLAGGYTTNITWQVNGLVTFDAWNLHFSDDGGNTWTSLAENLAPETLSYTWLVPPILTDQARIRLEMDIGGTIYEDISGVFTISDAVVTGLKNSEDKHLLHIYPNPVTDKMTITGLRQGDIRVRVLSLQGKLLINKPLTNNSDKITLNLTSLRPGPYLVETTQSNSKVVQKIILQK